MAAEDALDSISNFARELAVGRARVLVFGGFVLFFALMRSTDSVHAQGRFFAACRWALNEMHLDINWVGSFHNRAAMLGPRDVEIYYLKRGKFLKERIVLLKDKVIWMVPSTEGLDDLFDVRVIPKGAIIPFGFRDRFFASFWSGIKAQHFVLDEPTYNAFIRDLELEKGRTSLMPSGPEQAFTQKPATAASLSATSFSGLASRAGLALGILSFAILPLTPVTSFYSISAGRNLGPLPKLATLAEDRLIERIRALKYLSEEEFSHYFVTRFDLPAPYSYQSATWNGRAWILHDSFQRQGDFSSVPNQVSQYGKYVDDMEKIELAIDDPQIFSRWVDHLMVSPIFWNGETQGVNFASLPSKEHIHFTIPTDSLAVLGIDTSTWKTANENTLPASFALYVINSSADWLDHDYAHVKRLELWIYGNQEYEFPIQDGENSRSLRVSWRDLIEPYKLSRSIHAIYNRGVSFPQQARRDLWMSLAHFSVPDHHPASPESSDWVAVYLHTARYIEDFSQAEKDELIERYKASSDKIEKIRLLFFLRADKDLQPWIISELADLGSASEDLARFDQRLFNVLEALAETQSPPE